LHFQTVVLQQLCDHSRNLSALIDFVMTFYIIQQSLVCVKDVVWT